MQMYGKFEGFPINSALFGLVSYNDPWLLLLNFGVLTKLLRSLASKLSTFFAQDMASTNYRYISRLNALRRAYFGSFGQLSFFRVPMTEPIGGRTVIFTHM